MESVKETELEAFEDAAYEVISNIKKLENQILVLNAVVDVYGLMHGADMGDKHDEDELVKIENEILSRL